MILSHFLCANRMSIEDTVTNKLIHFPLQRNPHHKIGRQCFMCMFVMMSIYPTIDGHRWPNCSQWSCLSGEWRKQPFFFFEDTCVKLIHFTFSVSCSQNSRAHYLVRRRTPFSKWTVQIDRLSGDRSRKVGVVNRTVVQRAGFSNSWYTHVIVAPGARDCEVLGSKPTQLVNMRGNERMTTLLRISSFDYTLDFHDTNACLHR